MRAVRLYLKSGKRIGATIRQLGCPTKNSLKSWHREYERCHDLPAGHVRSRPRYSIEQKKAAVDHYLSHDRCAAATLRALGYPNRATLAAWIEELRPEIGRRIVGRVAGSVPKSQEVRQA
jgi:transposase-like protein